LLALWTLGFDTDRHAEGWRGPAAMRPGSPWPRETVAGGLDHSHVGFFITA